MKKEGPAGGRARFKTITRDGFAVEDVDLNGDGKNDQWTIKDSNGPKRYERDMNFDGKVDMWQYPGPDGVIEEEEMDLDLDGKIDVVVFYKDGIVSKKAMSIDFTGRLSLIKFYDIKGNLLRIERDDDGDGAADVFEYYENKRRVRIGWDEDGDGNPDRFDSLQ